MIKKLLLFFILLDTGFAFGQKTTSYIVNIDSLAEASLPVKPGFRKTDTSELYIAKTPSAYYLIVVQKMKNKKGFSLTKNTLESFYQQNMQANLNFAKGKLLWQEDILMDSLKAINYEYKTTGDTLPDIRFQRTVFLNNTLINFCFWTLSDSLKVNLPKKDAFFKSAIIIAQGDKAEQYTGDSMAYKIGNILFRLVIVTFIIFIVMGVVKKVNSKKTSNEPS